jgi:hypothetical protein
MVCLSSKAADYSNKIKSEKIESTPGYQWGAGAGEVQHICVGQRTRIPAELTAISRERALPVMAAT